MKYTRKFEKRNPTGRAAGTGRIDSRTLARKILSAVAALSVAGQPFAALASTVTRVPGASGGEIKFENGVGKIYAETVKGDVAVNRFDQFNITAGDIANMYFREQNKTNWAGSLVNFVNNRIDVAGTVNAIKDNQIGGNLYFLSASGMAVTGSGVINAGSLFVMTPTKSFMDSMMTNGVLDTDAGKAMLNNITRAEGAESWAVIPINPSGTITVLGKINAVDHVEMRAAHIGIGKNISGEDLKNTDGSVLIAKDAMNTAAAVTTGVPDFSNLVNLNSSQLSAANITSLTAAKSPDGGDIILTAYNDGSGTEISSPVFEDTINEGKNTFKRQDFVVSVENYGTIDAAGGVDITAHAVNANADTNGQSTTNKSAAQLASVSASVVIDGAVTAKDDVNVSAAAENRYVDNTGLFTKYAESGISFVMPVVGDVAYSALKTNADVTVGPSGSLTSSKGNVNVSAKADTLAASEASALGLRYGSMFPGGNQNNVPAAATVYTEAENTASVTVNGNVTAKKDVSITADGKLTIDAANKMRIAGNESANDIVVGVTVARADNKASVTIGGTEEKKKTISAGGDLTAQAAAESDFSSAVEVQTGDDSALAAAINVAQFSSAANLAVDNADLTAGGALTAAAENTITGDSVTTENGVGLGSWASSAYNVTIGKGIQDGALDGMSSWLSNAFKGTKKGQDAAAEGESSLLGSFDMTEYFKGGASITYSDQTHDSGVTIGSGASLTAGGDLAVSAATAIEDVHMTALGATRSYDDDSSTEAVINASVLVSDMSNSAKVTVEGGEGEAGATLKGGKSVRVTSGVTMDYNRIDKMVNDITEAVNLLKENMDKLPDDLKGDASTLWANVKGKYNALKEGVDALDDETLLTTDEGSAGISDKISAAWDLLTALNDLNSKINAYEGDSVQDIKNSFNAITDIVTGALGFADVNNYANFAAASSAKSSSGSDMTITGKNPTAGNGAGSVILNTVNTASVVDVGPGAAITANETAEISADSLVKDVTLGGLGTTGFNNSGGKTASVGATVNYSEFNNDTAAVVGAGTAVTAGHIDVSAANELNHVSVAGSAGMGAANSTHTKGFTVNGMVTVVEGGSRVLALVDDGAQLTANQNPYTEDDEKRTTDGGVSITSRNDAGVVNVAAGLTIGSGTASVGAALAIAGYDVKNTAGIDDVKSADDGDIISSGLLSGDHTAAEGNGSVSAYGLTIDAAAGGSIQSVAAGVSISKNDNSGEAGFFDNANKFYTNTMDKIVGNQSVLNTLGDKVFGSGTSLSDVANAGEVTHGSSLDKIDMGAANNYMPSFSLAGVGSVAVNTIDASTKAVADHATVTIQTPKGAEKGSVNVTARDASYVGAYAGSAAGQWKSGSTETADGRASSAAVAGAAAVNDMSNALSAVVSDSTIEEAGEVNTMALSGSQQLALGLGLTGVKSEGDSTSVGASISVNLIDHDVEALHQDNTVTAADSVNVTAYVRDIESTGSVVLNVGLPSEGKQGAVGANIGVAMLENNISAGIEGGSYEVEDGVQVSALNALKNITVGASAGVTTGNDKSFAVEGTGVYNEVTNETHAYIRGSEGKEASITTGAEGSVAVAANDTAVDEDSVPESVLTDGLADQTGSIQERMGDMVDLSGAKYMNETGDSVVSGDDTITISKGSGSSIVTVAASASGSNGGAGGAAVAITKVKNDFHAEADYADITAKDVDVSAGSDTNIVNVAAGVGGGGKLAGAASVSWNDVTNTAEAAITHSVVKAQSAAAEAVNTAHIVSVTGQLAASGKTAVGAGIGYVGLDNSTQANISDTTLEKRDSDDGITVTADAANRSSSYNIGVNVGAAGETAVNGTVAVTQTRGTSGAVMDHVTIRDAKRVSAAAADETDILSVIGTVSAAGDVAVGAGVAYTDIGGSSTDTGKGQRVTAAIRDSAITTAEDGGPQISVTAADKAKVTSIAIGVGGSGKVAVQGASAATLINKTTTAEMNNTDVDKDTNDAKNAFVSVSAVNDSTITSSADTASISGTAAVGAGVAVNRIIQNTNAAVKGGTMHVNMAEVIARSKPRIENIGIGVAGSGTAAVSGSVAVNMIENNTTAHIGGANITADGSVGILADSDEQIANYAGQLAVSGAGGSAGISVSVNDIRGETSATVGDADSATAITAKGNTGFKSDTGIDVGTQIHDTLISDDTVDMNTTIARTEENRSGVIVDATSTRDMKSFLVTGSAIGTGGTVAGSVNVNQIEGATTAAMTNTTVNGGADGAAVGTGADVYVTAGDYTNSSGFVGSLGAAATGGGVGMASDTNTITRTTTAEITDSSLKTDAFDVSADSAQGISSFAVGAGLAGVGGDAAGIVTVTDLAAETRAVFKDSIASADTASVTANHTGIVNAGNATVGAGVLGVGAGLSVGVLKDNTITEVSVGDEDAQAISTHLTTTGDTTISAANTTTTNPVISATGAGAGGVAGATSINNLNSTVRTNITGADVSSGGSLTASAKNTLNVDAYMGSIGAGVFGGVGAGVTVNTIDSTVQTNVNGSTLTANEDVSLTAEEDRNIEQTATNATLGGAALGANIAVTTVGQKITDADTKVKVEEANKALGENGSDASSLLANAQNALETADVDNVEPKVDAGLGGGKDSQITVNMSGSTVNAGETFTASAAETDAISMTLGSGTAGAAAVSAGVGILNIHRNVAVNIGGENAETGISAKNIDIGSVIDGTADLNVYQGTGGVWGALGGTYAGLFTTGNASVMLNNAVLTADTITAHAADTSVGNLDAWAVTAGGVAMGALITEAENNSNVSIGVSGASVLKSEDKEDGEISLKAEKANTITAESHQVTGGLVSGSGLSATVTDAGSTYVAIGDGNTMQAKKLTASAADTSALTANVLGVGGGALAAGALNMASVTVGSEKNALVTEVSIGKSNVIASDDADFTAETNISQTLDMDAVSVSGLAAGQVNTAETEAYSTARVTAGVNQYRGYEDGAAGDFLFSAGNTVTQNLDASGVSVAGFFATGTNWGTTATHLTTAVDLAGTADGSRIDGLEAKATGTANVTNNVNGDGGALADVSPFAAVVKNTYESDTDVTLKGAWNAAGSLSAQALNGMDIDLMADAVRAAIIGGSGTWLHNVIDNAADVNLTDASITTGGAQSYTAENRADYTGVINGSGYGGLNVNATDFKDDIDFHAAVTMDGSTLTAEGDEGRIAASASTKGSLATQNLLKAAGAVPVTLADSVHDIVYDNSVTVSGKSTLLTKKKDQDITLAASDNTDIVLETIADTQGGALGAASSKVTNKLKRSNTITVGDEARMESANDVNLYAGADANGKSSGLDINVISEAYNNTVIPLTTKPSLSNEMSQSNRVNAGGDVGSVRDINVKAGKGTTNLIRSTMEVNLYTGRNGDGYVASTLDGSLNDHPDETYENGINVTGRYAAGIHNKLGIDISGYTTTPDETSADYGTVNYDNIKVDITEGGDWFNPDNEDPKSLLNVTTLELENTLLGRYNELMSTIKDYAPGTKEYENLSAEIDKLIEQMKELHFVDMEKNTETGEWTQTANPAESITVQGIALPDILVSGGSIHLEGDSLTGSSNASMTANGAPEVTIRNSSDLYLEVHDVAIAGTGGEITFNSTDVSDSHKGSYLGSFTSDKTTGAQPQLTISSTSATSFDSNPLAQPDIGIFGDVLNPEGIITIQNTNHNIVLNDGSTVNGLNVQLLAERGSVSQTSTTGIYNVAGDPISQYQFNSKVAEAVQEYMNKLLLDDDKTNDSLSFDTFEEYRKWLIDSVGLTEDDLKRDDEETGYGVLAGSNVYINAMNVNINGLVQAGYGAYSTELGEDANGRITEIINGWDGNPILDRDVLGNSAFMVNEGGRRWNAEADGGKGLWEYEVGVYYNPYTKKLLVDSVTPGGGQIYINGAVSSTGNGRLMAMDGMANVDIDTTAVTGDTVQGIVINEIRNRDVEGLVSITDTNKTTDSKGQKVDGLVTEYQNGRWREYEYGTAVADRPEFTDIALSLGNASYTYNPEQGLRYEYTGGYEAGETNNYSYTDYFILWGGIDYSTSDEFLKKLAEKGIVTAPVSTTSSSGTELSSGVYIGKGNTGGDNSKGWYITGSASRGEETPFGKIQEKKQWGWHKDDSEKDPDWVGKMFGYGRIVYNWVTKNTTSTSTTSSIKADNPISIGFVGGNNNDGHISVTGTQNIELAGSISNAEIGGSGAGYVEISSGQGNIISADNVRIISDDVRLHAATGIDVSHVSIGDTAKVSMDTDGGNINFDSLSGDVSLIKAVTGGTDPIDAKTGSVFVSARGSILNGTDSGYVVKGQRIDLVSTDGSIGTKDKALTVLGGSDLYSSDTMASSVNAQAQGDIVLTQTGGNMRLGTIVSETGDAVLTVSNGSFVDAHPTEDSASSTAEDKIARWLEAGLISADDNEDSSGAAAKEAREERLAGLTNRMETLASKSEHTVTDYTEAADAFFNDEGMKAAKEAYITAVTGANGDTDTINAAYADYKAAQDAYFESKGFTPAEQEVIASYAEVANSDNYGWSQNQLLYAVQDSVLNAEPGEVLTVETPNVSAKNITLNAAKGGVGVDGEAQTIAYGELNNVDNLKLLASAKAGDLTWGDDSVTIRQQQPITVQVTEETGAVNVTGRDNVYLAGVKDTQLHLNDIATAGDIRLQGDAGVDVSTLKGENLTIAGGTGSIGSTANDDGYVHTEMSGVVDARADGDISIYQTAGDLRILSAATKGAANFKADGSILMYNVPGSTAQGYINAGTELNLNAGGAVGSADTGIRVLDNGAVVNADAQNGGIYLAGTNSNHSDDGTLVLGTLTGESVNVTGEGSISLGREDNPATEPSEAVAGRISTTDGEVTLTAAKDIDLDNGRITAADGSGTVSLTARGGSVTQSEDAAGIHAGTVNISTTGSQILASAENVISRFAAEGLGEGSNINGSIDFVSAAENVSVTFGDETNKGITVHDGGITVTQAHDNGGSLTITGSATTTEAEEDTDASIAFTSTGGITNDGTLTSADAVTMTAKGDITQTGDVTAADDASFTTTGGAISLGGSVTSTGGNVTADTKDGAITVTGKAEADKDITLHSGDGAITVTGGAEAGENFSATTAGGDVTIGTEDGGGSVTAGTGDVTVTTGSGDVTVHGTSTAGKGFAATTGSGDITLEGAVTTGTDDVSASTGSGDITIGGVITSGNDVTAETEDGNITFAEAVHADKGKITADAKGTGSIRVTDNLSALGDISLAVNNGGILFEGSKADEHEEIHITSASGNITVTAAGAGDIMDTNGEGENGDWAFFTASGEGGEGGNITVRHDGTGDIDLYELTAKNDARVYAAGEGGTGGNIHIVNLNGDLVAIVTKNPDAEMRVEHMTAASRIELTGSDINLDTIRQREDGDGFLVLDLEASDPAQPITSLIIRDLGSPVGTRFEQLWLKDGFIHSSSGALHFDKLFVEDLFTAETPYMKTDVWGAPPVLDTSKDTIYWIDTSKNRPSASLDGWYDPSVDGGWMYLHFDGAAPRQDSNGHLLYGKNGSEVYSRRHSLVEWMNRFQDRDFYDGERAAETLLSYHDRYGLISGGGAAAENADESEITVE